VNLYLRARVNWRFIVKLLSLIGTMEPDAPVSPSLPGHTVLSNGK
jgi:hypothetical protein